MPACGDHHRPGGDEQHVAGRPQHRPAARLQTVDRRRLEPERPRHADQAQVHRPGRVVHGPVDRGTNLVLGERLDQRHARHAAERGDVADRLVRVAGPARHEAGERADVDHLRALGRVVVDLLVRARREEAGERVDGGDQPGQRHRAGLRDHVLLGDPALEETVGIPLAEGDEPGVEAEVGVERDEPRLRGGRLEQRLAVGRDEPLPLLRRRTVLRRLGLYQRDRRCAERLQPPVQAGLQLDDRELVLVRADGARVVAVQRGVGVAAAPTAP